MLINSELSNKVLSFLFILEYDTAKLNKLKAFYDFDFTTLECAPEQKIEFDNFDDLYVIISNVNNNRTT